MPLINFPSAKLLDVEDLADSVKPDERSVMTYISEFFHVFSAQNLVCSPSLSIV